MSFDAKYALGVALPLAEAAYQVMDGAAVLPAGFEQTALITANPPQGYFARSMTMLRNTSVVGLAGRSADTSFIALRGSETPQEWLQDFAVFPADFGRYGDVADGFLDVYAVIRAGLMSAERGLSLHPQLLIVGHSLGGALAELAAVDIAKVYGIEPRVITFGAPKVGLHSFATTFNTAIESCFRVTNFLDIVPHVPPPPFVHVGTGVRVDSGGPIGVARHLLPAYRKGLQKMEGQQ